ncbi:NAD-binding protein [Calocera viscosa TUFC12733]|uniref:NAD-binding protein n=1 Tax=Calocera viscosa (strain TUFC12733) TaxID=1330018 RepID=A0A167IMY9_CALVF|nr:NAD-binding protein [Calocera viscosa TUFC12733]
MPSSLSWILQWPWEVFPPRAKFGTGDIPDLTGRVALVTVRFSPLASCAGERESLWTGAEGCTGREHRTRQSDVQTNARVYLAARDPQKAATAIADLLHTTGKECRFLHLDLADLGSVRRAGEEFLREEKQLHLLFCNARGAMYVPMDQVTAQGYDMQFGTNVLGHAYLTMLLLPLLVETAAHSPAGAVRVVSDSSIYHTLAGRGGIRYDTLLDGPVRRKKLSTAAAYAQSKWANVVFAKELARRYGEKGVVSTSLNPGIIRTELLRHSAFHRAILNWSMFDADPEGALTQLYAGTSPATASAHGQYFIPLAREGVSRPDTYSEEAGRRLWEWIEQATAGVEA